MQWCSVVSPGGTCKPSPLLMISRRDPPFLYHYFSKIIIYRYYAAAFPSLLNVFSSQCFLIINSIAGGQALAAVSNKLNDTLGIVIIGLISFAVRSNYRIIRLKMTYSLSISLLFVFLNRSPYADTNLYTGIYIFIL